MTSDTEATAFLTDGRPVGHSARPMTGLEQTATSLDLGALVQAVRRGDEDAFSELHRLLAPKVFDYLVVLTGDRTAAEDLLQRTFLEAWQSLASLHDPAKVQPWIYALARHIGQNHLRSRGTAVPLEAIPELEAGEPGPEDVAISDDATRLVWSAAESLEPQHREALNLSLHHDSRTGKLGTSWVSGLPGPTTSSYGVARHWAAQCNSSWSRVAPRRAPTSGCSFGERAVL